MDYPKATVEASLTSDSYPDIDSIVDVTICGRKQTVDQMFKVLSEKFTVIDRTAGGGQE